ncbi:MAG: glycosyltransferase family 2 protein [Chloroflexi bacterium]|nr:glycosyltransferase family 2 protein [Chloroflexota bacterium]MCL5275732.1 glycosyltransferase family 2 protein [Chloroflexota bacterium]
MNYNDQESQQPTLSIIVPAYNEEKRLPSTLDRLIRFISTSGIDSELIIVDDGSKDSTRELVRAAMRQYSGLRLIENPHSGKAYTVRTGLMQARGKYALHADADLSTPPEEFLKLVNQLKSGYDVAIGSRAGRPGAPWYRLLMSAAWRVLVSVVVVSGFRDTQCGFKAYRTPVAQHILRHTLLYNTPAESLTTASVAAASDVEMLYIARKLGYKIAEVPLEWVHHDESKIRPMQDSLNAFVELLRIRWFAVSGAYKLRTKPG